MLLSFLFTINQLILELYLFCDLLSRINKNMTEERVSLFITNYKVVR